MNRRHYLLALTSVVNCGWMEIALAAVPMQPHKETLQPHTLSGSGNSHLVPDPLYPQAVAVIMANQKASIALVQRYLRSGYARTVRMFEAMESAGIIGTNYVHGYRQIQIRHFT